MEENVQGTKNNKAMIIGIVAVIAVIAIVAVCALLLKPSYKGQIKDFVEAMSSEEKMDKFVEKKVNLRALYAMEQVEKEENLDTDDEKAMEKAFTKAYKNAKKADYEKTEYVDSVKSLYKMMTQLTAASDGVKIKVKDIGKLKTFDEFKLFKKADFTIEVSADGNSQDVKLYGVFYKNKLVLFGADSEGSSLMM